MQRIPRVFAAFLALALLTSPASAVITWDDGPAVLPPTTFPNEFDRLDNEPLSISGRAWALAVFAGQSWGYTPKEPNEDAPWEYPVGPPTSGGTNLSLFGQYQLKSQPTPPVGPNPVPVLSPAPDWRDPKLAQNIGASHSNTTPLSWFGGLVDDFYFYGITSILFQDNINTFSTTVLDAGRHGGTALGDEGGPIHFAFYGRQGQFLGQVDFLNSRDGNLNFYSSAVDIAGVQIWHKDTKGLEFSAIAFGITPSPATVALVVLGLLAMPRFRIRR